MIPHEFNIKFKELITEYRSLADQINNATDEGIKQALRQQMHDNVRRQNALREEYSNQQGE